jgi:hypothetical protein
LNTMLYNFDPCLIMRRVRGVRLFPVSVDDATGVHVDANDFQA